jgi:hypothetical protein
MTDIQVLELTGDGAPQVSIHRLALEAFARLTPAIVPTMRVIELVPRHGQLTWRDLQRMRIKAVNVLGSGALTQRLNREHFVHLDVTGAIRELQSTVAALRANAEVDAPIMILDVAMPGGGNDFGEIISSWQTFLEDDQTRTRGTIERPPPQSAEAEAAAGGLLGALLADTRQFYDSTHVGRALSSNPDQVNPKMVATRKRKAGEIFAAWDGNAYRYPVFQFDADGRVRARVPDLIEVLPRDEDGSNGDAALWLFAPDAALDDRTPAEVFPTEPDRVIALAHRRFRSDESSD